MAQTLCSISAQTWHRLCVPFQPKHGTDVVFHFSPNTAQTLCSISAQTLCSISAQTNKGFGRLRWYILGGLSSVRNMKVNARGPSTPHVTVTHPGYYYVYSHVTYDSSSGRESKKHMIYKNYRYSACGRLNESDIGTKRRKRKPQYRLKPSYQWQ